MARQRPHRPEPRFEKGYFMPAVPVPDPRNLNEYRWHDMFSTISKVVRNPLESFNHSQFKDPVTQYKLLGNHFTTINDPDVIKHCFIDNRDNYRFNVIRQKLLRSILGDGLITAEGEKWKHARHAMSPMFTPRNVKSFAQVMKTTIAREMDNLFLGNPESKAPEARSKLSAKFSALTYLVLSDTLFSGDIDREQSHVINDVATALLYVGRPDPLDLFQAPDWIPRLSRMKGLKAIKSLRLMIGKVLQKRKSEKQSGKDIPDDFLTRLLNVGDPDHSGAEDKAPFSDTEIEDHLLSFIGAGHETTARALSWLFYLLSNDTDSRDRFEAEIDALNMEGLAPEKWINHMPFAMACFEETMRLFPPAPFIVREAIDQDRFKTVTIPAKGILFVNTWILHRHEALWDDPSLFKPVRFLEDAKTKIGRFQYLPFGLGARVCIGQRFAMQEAAILMAMLTKRYRFDYTDDSPPWPKLRITIQAENNMPMRVTRR